MNDHENSTTYAKRCADQYRSGHNPALTAKAEKLLRETRKMKTGDANELEATSATRSHITGMLSTCNGSGSRAKRILDLLVRQSNSLGGFLYLIRKEGPVLSAQSANCSPFREMDTMVQDRISDELDGCEDMTEVGNNANGSRSEVVCWPGQQSEQYRPVLIGHSTQDGFAVTGIAVLLEDPSKSFNFPGDTVFAVSKSLLDAGDVTLIFTRT